MKGANMGTFKRYDGYTMHVPQEFIDSHLPVCPFCHSNRPHWLLDSRMEMSLTGHRTHYQCEQCRATISSTSIDAAAEKGKQFHYNTFVAALNAAQKGSKHQQVGVTYLRVEELGSVCTNRSLLGVEYPITFFQQMAGAAQPMRTNPTVNTLSAESSYSAPFITTSEYSGQPQPQPQPQIAKSGSDRPWMHFALIGMILGIVIFPVTILLFIINGLAAVAGYLPFLAIPGLVFSILGLKSSTRHSKAIVGMVLNIVAISLASILFFIAIMSYYY